MTHSSVPSHNKASLLAVMSASDDAAAAIAADYREALDSRNLDTNDQNWEVGLDLAAYRAASIIYEAGSPLPADAASAIESYVDHINDEDRKDWLATTDMHKHMVRELVERGLKLAHADKDFAYGPHSDGRAHETIDGPDAKYNKFGAQITA